MGGQFIFIGLILFLLAIFTGEDFVFTLLYLLLGTYLLSRLWGSKALGQIVAERKLSRRVFLGEKVDVDIDLVNRGWLPIVWLHAQESLPLELVSLNKTNHVISLGPYAKTSYRYQFEGRKRGYYTVGPLNLTSGDLFGVSEQVQRSVAPTAVTVYPKIIQLNQVPLLSRSPTGTLGHALPIFEDPARVMGVRDYISGDSLRRINWKTSASSGQLKVKKFEPSIALEASIFLNLNIEEYHIRDFFYASELAIVVAASIANWVVSKRQMVGLVTNGTDPHDNNRPMMAIPPRPGRGHLMRILDSLARVQASDTEMFAETLYRESRYLAWGTSMILVTGSITDALFEAIFQASRVGLLVMLLPVGRMASSREAKEKAAMFGIPYFHIGSENDLDQWRK